ncbi:MULTISPECIES: hypothetical protein [unclassified Spirillospora]|uniref:hypothetical protein n=1 Tax=unclassified Spirillospora TaxID=2642701 RepID=UPI0037237C4E
MDPTDTVVTAVALHTQRNYARFPVEDNNTHFILVAKKNQPSLYHQLKRPPCRRSRPVDQINHEVSRYSSGISAS